MDNIENLEKCAKYVLGEAREDFLFRNKVVFCYAKVCPYNKEFTFSLDEEKMTLCKSEGLLKKIEIENPDKTKKKNDPLIYNKPKFDGKIPQASYFQIKYIE